MAATEDRGEIRWPARPEALAEADYALLAALARNVAARRLSVPAIFFLESTRPLNFVGAQAMVFFGPFVKLLVDGAKYDRYAALLEDRPTVELFLRMLEAIESAASRREQAEKVRRRGSRGPWWRRGK